MAKATESVTAMSSISQAAQVLTDTLDHIEQLAAQEKNGAGHIDAAYERRAELEQAILATEPATANEALALLLVLSDAVEAFGLNYTIPEESERDWRVLEGRLRGSHPVARSHRRDQSVDARLLGAARLTRRARLDAPTARCSSGSGPQAGHKNRHSGQPGVSFAP